VTDYTSILKQLHAFGVEFIVVGGIAAIAHGSARFTKDVDVVYRRTPDNIDRLVAAFAKFDPYPRGAPRGLPFQWDSRTISAGLNFTLVTSLGDLDLLGEITGGGSYEQLLASVETKLVYGVDVKCLTLEKLIETKHAAGRPKDFEAIAELEALRDERDKTDTGR
jgi:predicted nucleotidyltransferase